MNTSMQPCPYVIVTPAFNEAQYLKATIESVMTQTILPLAWVIVDDGSTDASPDIIRLYASVCPWIRYIRREKVEGQSYYGSNVYAILYGLKHLQSEAYEFLAVLDADITLTSNYYEQIFERFEINPELGIATGVYCEQHRGQWTEVMIDRQSTPKAIQVFRRTCYEACGGYIPMMYGGEDAAIEITARKIGWQTWSFPEIRVRHCRPVGTAKGGEWFKVKYQSGLTDYAVGMHPVFVLFKYFRRGLKERPWCLSGLARLAGYVSGALRCVPRQLPLDTRRYLRQEQIKRLIRVLNLGPKPWEPYLIKASCDGTQL